MVGFIGIFVRDCVVANENGMHQPPKLHFTTGSVVKRNAKRLRTNAYRTYNKFTHLKISDSQMRVFMYCLR